MTEKKKDMETKYGNKLIADFMGQKTTNENWPKWEDGLSHINNLRYHSSWDSLMPVAKKIHEWSKDNLVTVGGGYSVDIKIALREIDIFSTWQAIIKFIQWYNQTNFLESKEEAGEDKP